MCSECNPKQIDLLFDSMRWLSLDAMNKMSIVATKITYSDERRYGDSNKVIPTSISAASILSWQNKTNKMQINICMHEKTASDLNEILFKEQERNRKKHFYWG